MDLVYTALVLNAIYVFFSSSLIVLMDRDIDELKKRIDELEKKVKTLK